ncbi:hypothetical protein BDR26DRAFT_1017538 [Obelidium mucronatum]|nr:hypothetical protein BDR26DRAFT_1017538 [Obelidium mucronatum]
MLSCDKEWYGTTSEMTKGKRGLPLVLRRQTFSAEVTYVKETERQKRAFLNISRSGASSSASASSSAAPQQRQPLQPVSSPSASTSRKRPRDDHDENEAEDDEDEDDSSKNRTPLQRAAVLGTSPATGVITPTPATSLTAALDSALNQHQPLSHQKPKKASWVWAYFDKSKTVPKPALGANRYAYVCQVILDENRLCGKPITAELKPSTKALPSHLTNTHGLRAPISDPENDTTPRASTILPFLKKRHILPQNINKSTVRFMTLRTIISNNFSFRFIESPTVMQWATFFCPAALTLIETATTYRTNVLPQTYHACHSALKLYFVSLNSKIAISGDVWTAFMKLAFFGLRANWIDVNFNYHSTTIGFVPLTGSHAYDKDAQALEHVRCFPHILNLAVSDAVSGLCGLSDVIGNESGESDDGDFDEPPEDIVDQADDESNNDIQDSEAEHQFDTETLRIIETLARAVSMDNSRDIVKSLTSTVSACPDDVRKLVKKAQAAARMLANSPTLRKRLEDQCIAMVAPREHAKYCIGFSRDDNMAFKDTDLRHFKDLKQFLQPFYNATKRLSIGHKPTIHIVVPLMVSLCSDLKAISNGFFPYYLRNGAACALEKLEKYAYEICSSDAYIIPTETYAQSLCFFAVQVAAQWNLV